ncbi:MAG TPA: hypothetical protein VJT73_18530 [Polyangiaceae bacterium]|nr:hypothetical protein [Polyangiaceae bacterium]
MATSRFSDKNAQAEVAASIKAIERVTSAEIVVAVRPSSGYYRHADYLVGFIASLAVLVLLLFSQQEFPIDWMPLDVLAGFAVGAAFSANVPVVRRTFASRRWLRRNVETAARAAFVDLGISRTTGRSGILVYASMFEKRVVVLTDMGIDRVLLGGAFETAIASLDHALRGRARFLAFVEALRSLGPILAKTLPRLADDVNELPDEPVA